MDAPELHASECIGRDLADSYQHSEYCPFRKYYQIGGSDEPDVANPEPKKRERELKGHTEPAHSPFGLIGQIARDTGWNLKYILRGVNYPTLILMWQDHTRYVERRKKTPLELFRELEAEENKKSTPGRKKGVSPLSYFQQLENEEEE